MSKEALANLVDLTLDEDRKNFSNAAFKSIPEGKAEPWEVKAIEEGRKDREKYRTIAHEDINWK